MKFGGSVLNAVHKMSAQIRGTFISLPASYTPVGGDPATVYMTPEPVDTMTQEVAVNFESVSITGRYRIFVLVLSEQEIDFVAFPPKDGDLIEIIIGDVVEKWEVKNSGNNRCYGFIPGNRQLWIFTRPQKPPKQ